MSAVLSHPDTPPEPVTAPGRSGSLFLAELHRFTARRFIRVVLGVAVLGWLLAVGVGLYNYGEPTVADYAAAREEVQAYVAEDEEYRQECIEDAESFGEDPERVCWPALRESDLRVEDFMSTAPFDLGYSGAPGALGVATVAAVLGFLVGATSIGAEWSSRAVVALLFWVPNRLRVIGTKLGVLAVAATLLGVLAQVSWLAMAGIWHADAGTDRALPSGFWAELLTLQGRAVLLTVLITLIGFGLANLLRNTGAALGIGFAYVVVIEGLLGFTDPSVERWLLSTNAAALVVPGGVPVYDFDAALADGPPVEHIVSNLQGGLVVSAFAAVLVGVGVLLFARRDLH